MLMPKRVKHRKQQRGKMRGRAYRGNKVTYGDFGIMAITHMDHIQPDRSSTSCYDKTYQTWR